MNATIRRHRGTVEVELPLKTESETNKRGHWAKKHRRASEQRNVTKMRLWCPVMHLIDQSVTVTLTRIAPRRLDDDNVRAALKSVRDGVADALSTDDRDPLVTWEYRQERGAPRYYAVRIRVEVMG